MKTDGTVMHIGLRRGYEPLLANEPLGDLVMSYFGLGLLSGQLKLLGHQLVCPRAANDETGMFWFLVGVLENGILKFLGQVEEAEVLARGVTSSSGFHLGDRVATVKKMG